VSGTARTAAILGESREASIAATAACAGAIMTSAMRVTAPLGGTGAIPIPAIAILGAGGATAILIGAITVGSMPMIRPVVSACPIGHRTDHR
jgi:hypothetical protein